MPNNKDIEEAKKFLLKRLDAEQSASRNLEIELVIFANKLLALYKKYGLKPDDPLAKFNEAFQYELQVLIRDFKDTLYDDVELLCVNADEDRKQEIIAYINATILGITLKSRLDNWISQYVNTFFERVNKDIKQVTSIPVRIGAAYGLDRLLRQTVADAYMNEWKEQHPNAIGFVPHRGSSYDCGVCDSHAEKFHPMSEYPSYGNFHVNCMCVFEFIYSPEDIKTRGLETHIE